MGFSRQEYWSGLPLPSPHPDMTTGKTITLTYGPLSTKQCLCFFITVWVCHSYSFKEQASFNFMAAVPVHSDFGAKKMKSVTVSTFYPSICQGALKSLLQHHSSKTSILQHSAFFIAQLSHPYVTTGKTIALTRRTGDGDGQGGLACCDSWGRKESDTTERLN